MASRASSAGAASPMGEPVARLPPIVAPLRISREANWGNSSASRGTRPSSRRSISERVSAAPISMMSCVAEVELRSSGRRSMAMTRGGAGAAEVDLDAPVGRSGDEHGVGVLARAARGRRPGRRLGRTRRRRVSRVCAGAGAPLGAAGGERVVAGRRTEREGGVTDRPVAGAAAQVAGQGVQVEAVGAVLVVRALVPAPWRAPWSGPSGPGLAVVLGGHAADEAGRAVAALRPAAHRQLVLHRVQ